MRLFFTTDIVGGVWRYTTTLVRELTARGHDCAVAILGEPDATRLDGLPPEVEVAHKDLRLEWMPGGLEDLAEGAEWLSDFARRWDADVAHLNQFGYSRGEYGAPVLVMAHSDVRSWFDDVRGTEAPPEWQAYTSTVREGLAAADVVVAPTAYQSGRLAQHYGRTAARVIHNGMHAPATTVEDVPASDRSMLMVAGRAWDEAKGVGVLDEALESLGNDAPTVHVVGPLEGPSGERIHVRRLVAHGEVPGEAMDRFYSNTRVYIGPSLYEPFGLSPLEAAAHGCGLLLSGIGSFRELWQDEASFFQPGHSGDLALRLLNLLEEPETLDRQAARARERALTEYTAERMTDQYEALYRELVRTASGGEAAGAGASAGREPETGGAD